MGSLLKIALSALAASGRGAGLAAFTGRMGVAVLLAGFALILVATAWGCVCAALWLALIPPLGPIWAPLVVAGACLGFAGILALAAWLLVRRRRMRPSNGPEFEALLGQAERFISDHKGAALLAAVLAGMLAGNSGRKR